MFSRIRLKFGTIAIWGIIGFIAFVFVFSGVFSPKATRGLHEGAVAGKVNGESITLPEFNRELNQQMEMFRNMGGGAKLTEEQIKQIRLRDRVFQELVRRKLMTQEAVRQGLHASDEEVMQRIREMPVFQKDGKFDMPTYRQVLGANNYNPGGFERVMREDLSLAQWENYFRVRAQVSDEEIRREFLLAQDKRDIKYVLVTKEAGRKDIKVDDAAVKQFVDDPAKLNIAKSKYEARKTTEYKAVSFDQAKDKIVREILASEKLDEIRKNSDRIADEVIGLLGADKKADEKVNARLKPYGIEVKTAGQITRRAANIPGVGEVKDLTRDIFAGGSQSGLTLGGKPRKYTVPAGTLVALMTGSVKPDLGKIEAERENLLRSIKTRKERELMGAWLKKLQATAKIDPNPAVVGGG